MRGVRSGRYTSAIVAAFLAGFVCRPIIAIGCGVLIVFVGGRAVSKIQRTSVSPHQIYTMTIIVIPVITTVSILWSGFEFFWLGKFWP